MGINKPYICIHNIIIQRPPFSSKCEITRDNIKHVVSTKKKFQSVRLAINVNK